MTNYQQNKDIIQQIKDLQVRVEAVEKFNPLNNGTIDEGGMLIKEGGIQVLFPTGETGILFGHRENTGRIVDGSAIVDDAIGFTVFDQYEDILMSMNTWLSDGASFVQFGDATPEDIGVLDAFTVFTDNLQLETATELELIARTGDIIIGIDPDNLDGELFFSNYGGTNGIINFSWAEMRFFDMPTTGSAANVRISQTGNPTMSVSTSAKRFKQDIEDFNPPIDNILNIQPKTWRDKSAVAKDPNTTERHFGAIAEDLVALGLDFLIDFDDNGEPWAIQYERVAIALIPAIKSHRARVKTLEDKVALLEKQVAALLAKVQVKP